MGIKSKWIAVVIDPMLPLFHNLLLLPGDDRSDDDTDESKSSIFTFLRGGVVFGVRKGFLLRVGVLCGVLRFGWEKNNR